MARNAFGNFAGSFLQAFTQSKMHKERREDEKKERDAKLKLFEIQMKREQQQMQQGEQQQGARTQLFEKLSGASPLQARKIGPDGQPMPAQQVLDPRGPTSLTDLLADPEGAMLLLRSGAIGGEDILKRQMALDNQKMMRDVLGGGGAPMGMELQGVKLGPDGQIMPDFGQPQVTTQKVDTPDGPRIRTFETRTGKPVADLGAPEPDRVTPEQGGRIQALKQAQTIIPQLMTSFISPDGNVERSTVMSAWSNAPGTDGRKVRAQLEDALDAVIRARTGAAVTKEELEGTLRQFLPHPLDNDKTIKDKLMRLDQFVNGAIDATTLPPRLRGMISEGGAAGGAPRPNQNVVDFSTLPP